MAVDTAPLSAATPEAGASSARKPLYEASTQFKNWRFSPEQLIQARENMNVVAVDAIRKTFETDAARQYALFARVRGC
jgi:cyclin H